MVDSQMNQYACWLAILLLISSVFARGADIGVIGLAVMVFL